MSNEEEYSDSQWLRDLNWAIHSPFLLRSYAHEQIEASRIEVTGIQKVAFRYTGHRVGYYFENLVGYWLEHIRQVEMIAQGYQVMREGRTVGELDFVFRDEAGVVNHWEVASKFYLYCAEHTVAGSHLIGPNAGDTYERKRDKILGRQLDLSKEVFPEVSRRVAFVKGRIFYHAKDQQMQVAPMGLAENHLRGTWLRDNELSLLERRDAAFLILRKPYWLSEEVSSEANDSLLTYRGAVDYLVEHFAAGHQPVLLCSLQKDGDEWREQERFFVVDKDWPRC